jgi:hypothetical protein
MEPNIPNKHIREISIGNLEDLVYASDDEQKSVCRAPLKEHEAILQETEQQSTAMSKYQTARKVDSPCSPHCFS